MDPLTIGFENALHDANRSLPDAATTNKLVADLQRVIDASPHRQRLEVSVAAVEPGRIELRKGEVTYVLVYGSGRWHFRGVDGSTFSGPVAAAITARLTS